MSWPGMKRHKLHKNAISPETREAVGEAINH